MYYIKTKIVDFINENKNNTELPEYWYHGSNKYFNEFNLDYLGKNYEQSILGVYFTQYLKPGIYGSTAKEYAEEMVRREGGKPYIYKCKIHTNNPLLLNSSGWYSSNTFLDKNRNDIKRWLEIDNNDSVIVYDFDNKDGFEYSDFILATKNLNIIEIVDIIEYK